MERAQTEVRPQTPYQVIREYRLFGAKSTRANAEVVAQIDFKPPTNREYSIQKWSGSTRGKQVVQRVLDRETASNSNQAPTALSSDNYDFLLVGETVFDGRPLLCFRTEPQEERERLDFGASLGG